jgi:hypothetical protein
VNESTTLASRVLLAELTKKVRERGLVFWVDSEGQYEAFGRRRSSSRIRWSAFGAATWS